MLIPENHVWVFSGAAQGKHLPGGIFSTKEIADKWIEINRLSGMLTAYPLDQGCFDWALANEVTNMKPETLAIKRKEPGFIASFSTASQAHYHYEDGIQVSG